MEAACRRHERRPHQHERRQRRTGDDDVHPVVADRFGHESECERAGGVGEVTEGGHRGDGTRPFRVGGRVDGDEDQEWHVPRHADRDHEGGHVQLGYPVGGGQEKGPDNDRAVGEGCECKSRHPHEHLGGRDPHRHHGQRVGQEEPAGIIDVEFLGVVGNEGVEPHEADEDEQVHDADPHSRRVEQVAHGRRRHGIGRPGLG